MCLWRIFRIQDQNIYFNLDQNAFTKIISHVVKYLDTVKNICNEIVASNRRKEGRIWATDWS